MKLAIGTRIEVTASGLIITEPWEYAGPPGQIYTIEVEREPEPPAEEALLRCPFCGDGLPEITVLQRSHPFVACGRCGAASSAGRTPEEARAAWNRRTPAPTPEVVTACTPDVLELLRDLLCHLNIIGAVEPGSTLHGQVNAVLARAAESRSAPELAPERGWPRKVAAFRFLCARCGGWGKTCSRTKHPLSMVGWDHAIETVYEGDEPSSIEACRCGRGGGE